MFTYPMKILRKIVAPPHEFIFFAKNLEYRICNMRATCNGKSAKERICHMQATCKEQNGTDSILQGLSHM